MAKNVFIGVAWPYVNGNLHIGHLAGYLLPADICARYNRIVGNNVIMVSGSDSHGTPITVQADKEGVSPAEIVEKYHKDILHLFFDVLGLTYDSYSRTDLPGHAKVTQDIFVKLLEGGYIYIGKSEQYYSEESDKFLPDRYVEGECPYCGYKDSRSDQCDECGKLIEHGKLINPRESLTGSSVELKETEHYYLDWPKLQPKLEEYVEKTGGNWKKWVESETLGWLKEGLKPREITRDLDWGVEIPVDRIAEDKLIENAENKRFYVWFDAVIGYLSGSKLWAEENNGDWEEYWKSDDAKHYYFMGKDNLVFHTLFWPGQLIGYDEKLHLPDVVSINHFLNLEGKQFSKSRGVVVDSKEIVEKFGNDIVRFYLTFIMPETRDSSFKWDDFKDKVNGVLVANFGNFIHRTLSIGKGHDAERLAEAQLDDQVIEEVQKAFDNSRKYLENCEFKNYLDSVIELSSFGNKYFDETKPWVSKKDNEAEYYRALKNLYFIVISLAYLVEPLLPEASEKITKLLGIEKVTEWPENINRAFKKKVDSIKPTEDPQPLFKKLEEEDLSL